MSCVVAIKGQTRRYVEKAPKQHFFGDEIVIVCVETTKHQAACPQKIQRDRQRREAY